jgi:outer membrane receptor protein involved in Fe transport
LKKFDHNQSNDSHLHVNWQPRQLPFRFRQRSDLFTRTGTEMKALRLYAGIYNLFDERYYQWARIRNVTRGNLPLHGYATDIGIGRYTEPRRNVRLSVTWSL